MNCKDIKQRTETVEENRQHFFLQKLQSDIGNIVILCGMGNYSGNMTSRGRVKERKLADIESMTSQYKYMTKLKLYLWVKFINSELEYLFQDKKQETVRNAECGNYEKRLKRNFRQLQFIVHLYLQLPKIVSGKTKVYLLYVFSKYLKYRFSIWNRENFI